jgi:hypothetical protein
MTAAFAGKPSAERQLRGIRGNTSGKKTNQGVREIKKETKAKRQLGFVRLTIETLRRLGLNS